jgi:hypothetical protein
MVQLNTTVFDALVQYHQALKRCKEILTLHVNGEIELSTAVALITDECNVTENIQTVLAQLSEFMVDSELLYMLENYGVDNWKGFQDALNDTRNVFGYTYNGVTKTCDKMLEKMGNL